MKRSLPLLLAAAAAAWAPAPLAAQSFSDFEAVGRLTDARKEARPLRVDQHTLEPRVQLKLLGVTTPHVFGAVGGGYTDNLLHADADEPGEAIEREAFGRAEAGVRFDTELGDHRLELGYRARATEYQGGRYDRREQEAEGRLDLYWNAVEVHTDLAWRRRAYPRQLQLRGLIRADELVARTWGQAVVGSFGVRLGGHYTRTEYLEDELEFFDTGAGGFDAQFQVELRPDLRVVLEYNWSLIAYREDVLDDYQMHQVRAGLDGEVSPKLHGSIKVGIAAQTVDDDASTGDDREYLGFVTEGAVRWQPLAFTALVFSYTRRVEPSTSSNFLLTDALRFAVTQDLFDEKLSLEAAVGYAHSVVRPGEHINRIDADLRAVYQLQDWLSVAGSYGFTNFESGFFASDYSAHTVYFSVGFGL